MTDCQMIHEAACGCGRRVPEAVVEAGARAGRRIACSVCGATASAREIATRLWVECRRNCDRPVRHVVTTSVGGWRVR